MTIRVHVFTNLPAVRFLKQSPDFSPLMDGVEFSFGLAVPDDADALIVNTRASYSIQTTLPRNRIAFFAGEPDVIHPYSTRFLNQFSMVLTTSEKPLETLKLYENYCSMPYVGLNFEDLDHPLNLTYFQELPCPPKNDKISIVTSNKTVTDFQKKRMAFLDVIKEKIPEYIEIYGHARKTVDDKKDAILDHKYHLALENSGGRFTWTEKLADPLLCWALPFYHGCTNLEDDIPARAFEYIDISKPDEVINQLIAAVKDDLWAERKPDITQARQLFFSEFNLMKKFAQIGKALVALEAEDPASKRKTLIRSERSFWPEKGCRGSIPETIIRSSLLFFDPNIELKMASFQNKLVARREAKRKTKRKAQEANQ